MNRDLSLGFALDGMRTHDELTVAALLRLPELRAARVLAGSSGLHRPVTWCLPWAEVASRGDSVDSVAVHARIDQLAPVGDLASLLREVAGRGASVLLLSGDCRALDFTELTDAPAELPIVHLPPSAGFAVVNRIVAEQSLARAVQVLEYGIGVHRSLATLLHRGSGLPALGRQLANLAQSPTFVLSPHGDVLSYEYLGAVSVPDPFEVARLLTATELAGSAVLAGAHPEVRVIELALEDERVACVVCPIVLDRKHYGTIAVVELEYPPAPQTVAQHWVIVEQAATIIGSELLRQRSVEEAMERTRGDFVHALLHSRFANPHDLIARAAHHDFDVASRYGVVAVRGIDAAGVAASQATMMSWVRMAEQVLPRAGVRTLATVVDDALVVIREAGPPATGRAESGPGQLAEYANALGRELEARLGGPVVVTYGRLGHGTRGIGESYREARLALGVCERLGMRQVCGYADLRVYAALADVATSPQAIQFAREVLGPLRGNSAGADLERTVLAYVEAGGNLNAAARELQLHRNTMLYKLDRAARLLGVDLREADNQFMIWLARRIDLLSKVQARVDERLRPAG